MTLELLSEWNETWYALLMESFVAEIVPYLLLESFMVEVGPYLWDS